MLALWGACNTAFGIAFQAEIIRYTRPDEASVAVALYSGIFNLGIGSGSFFGGMASTAFSLSSIGLVGGALAAWVPSSAWWDWRTRDVLRNSQDRTAVSLARDGNDNNPLLKTPGVILHGVVLHVALGR